MIRRLNHVGIIVNNLDDTLKIYERLFGLKPAVVKSAMEGKARVAFVPVGDGEVELIQPLDPSLPQSNFLQTRGQGIHHISLSTDDIDSEVDRMRKEGVAFAAEVPRIGAHGVKIIFTKPETTDSITVELCEER
jgi:methylmalonyl-CoA epimerase